MAGALEPLDGCGDPGPGVQAGQFWAWCLDVVAVRVEGSRPARGGRLRGYAVLRTPVGRGGDDSSHRQGEFTSEVQVALIVGGHRHDGAGAVPHEDVVSHKDGDRLGCYRINDVPAGEY